VKTSDRTFCFALTTAALFASLLTTYVASGALLGERSDPFRVLMMYFLGLEPMFFSGWYSVVQRPHLPAVFLTLFPLFVYFFSKPFVGSPLLPIRLALAAAFAELSLPTLYTAYSLFLNLLTGTLYFCPGPLLDGGGVVFFSLFALGSVPMFVCFTGWLALRTGFGENMKAVRCMLGILCFCGIGFVASYITAQNVTIYSGYADDDDPCGRYRSAE